MLDIPRTLGESLYDSLLQRFFELSQRGQQKLTRIAFNPNVNDALFHKARRLTAIPIECRWVDTVNYVKGGQTCFQFMLRSTWDILTTMQNSWFESWSSFLLITEDLSLTRHLSLRIDLCPSAISIFNWLPVFSILPSVRILSTILLLFKGLIYETRDTHAMFEHSSGLSSWETLSLTFSRCAKEHGAFNIGIRNSLLCLQKGSPKSVLSQILFPGSIRTGSG